MRPEPSPTSDCAVCGKPVPKTAARYSTPDGFCTSRCCRKWFGTELAVDKTVQTSWLAQTRSGFRDEEEAA